MSDIYQPQVAQVNSAVTPEQGVVDTSAVDLFVDVAKVATEATFSFTGQQELTDLKGKFDKITQARAAGGNSSALQIKARADLDAAKANTPWVSQQADELFRNTFGGGSGTGGIFKATPEEEVREKHAQLLEEVKLTRGLATVEEAQKRVSLNNNAKDAKIQADNQKEVREYNGELVLDNTKAQLTDQSVSFLDNVMRVMGDSGGSLDAAQVRSFGLAVDQEANRLRTELKGQSRDPKTGHLLLSTAQRNAADDEIDSWVSNTKAMLSDNSTVKVIDSLNLERSAEIQNLAVKEFPFVAYLKSVGGDPLVQSFFDIAKRPEGAAKELLIKSNPIFEKMFAQKGSFNQASLEGSKKVFTPVPDASIMSEAEAAALGTQLNDPANNKLMEGVVEQVGSNPDATKPYESMIQKNPDSAAMLWGNRFKAWSRVNNAKAEVVMDTTVSGLKKSFLSAYVSETGRFPEDFELLIGAPLGEGKITSGVPINKVRGSGFTRENSNALMQMYKVFRENSGYLKKVSAEAGEDLTPEQAVRYTVMGNVPTQDVEFKSDEVRDAEKDKAASEEKSALVQGRFKAAMERANTPELEGEVFKALLNGFFETDENGGVNLPAKK